MREIKFRAWRTDAAGSWMDRGEFYVGEDGLVYEGASRTYDTPNKEIEKIQIQPILMQFTGLLDKNGKEIYEGDIYKTKSPKKYMVMFEEGAFVGGESEGNCIPLGWKCDDEGLAKEDDMGWLEVIGNVYENPELVHNSQK